MFIHISSSSKQSNSRRTDNTINLHRRRQTQKHVSSY